jgi:hypothetical protein
VGNWQTEHATSFGWRCCLSFEKANERLAVPHFSPPSLLLLPFGARNTIITFFLVFCVLAQSVRTQLGAMGDDKRAQVNILLDSLGDQLDHDERELLASDAVRTALVQHQLHSAKLIGRMSYEQLVNLGVPFTPGVSQTLKDAFPGASVQQTRALALAVLVNLASAVWQYQCACDECMQFYWIRKDTLLAIVVAITVQFLQNVVSQLRCSSL